ncbi:UNVERIFIED_CONTAM: hypothetical protein H355_016206, partial [Colinus virginianus]
PALSQHGRRRAGPWRQPSGTPGPARCSPLLAFALSSPACVLCRQECAEPNNCGRILGICWMLAHEFCLIFANILFAETPSGREALDITHDDLTRKLKKANRKLEALNASTTPFQCPGCGNNTLFRKEMSTLGIHIPDRRPAWEENDVDASHLLQRRHRCDAIECFHPEGRDQAEEEG